MDNPWKNLKKINNEYIAECDKYLLNNRYFRNSSEKDYELKLNVTPGPYTGDLLNAKVYLLALNPGYDDNDILFSEKYENEIINNLLHIYDEYPFLILNPRYRNSAGANWWCSKLECFINNVGLEKTAKKVCNIEYFPYHSRKYKHNEIKLPSQEYSFLFIKRAIIEKKIIIIMRSEKLWYKTIPELENYEKKYVLNSPQNVKVSPNNLGLNNYKYIINELEI
jgi:hypothetical protein